MSVADECDFWGLGQGEPAGLLVWLAPGEVAV